MDDDLQPAAPRRLELRQHYLWTEFGKNTLKIQNKSTTVLTMAGVKGAGPEEERGGFCPRLLAGVHR